MHVTGCHFDPGHHKGGEVVSHHGFGLPSWMANDAEHLFTCSLAICLSLEKPLFEAFKLGYLALLLRFLI